MLWPEEDQIEYLRKIDEDRAAIEAEAKQVKLRKKQRPPSGDWFVWLIMSGRGFGKTEAGQSWFYGRGNERKREMLVAGRTPSDVRDYSLLGTSGLITRHPDLDYEPSKRLITWPRTGSVAHIRSGANPEEFRNFSGDTVWAEEFAAWKYPDDSWSNLMFGVREKDPRICMTTTPKPIKAFKKIMKAPGTIVVRGSTYENRSNLSERYFENVIIPQEGTRLGRQEIYGEVLEDTPGALWTRTLIEANRVRKHPGLVRVVISIDPAVSAGEESNETGIIPVALGDDGLGYVLDDLSGTLSPEEWARAAVGAYRTWEADRIIGEVNNGGDLVERNIRTIEDAKNISYKSVRASRGKYTRAEPIQSLYSQGKIKHVGAFPELEDQMCTWVPGDDSPDRLDALVWGFTELFYGSGGVSTEPNPFYD